MNTSSFNSFQFRHLGPRPHDAERMLETIGTEGLDALMDETVPPGIRRDIPLEIGEPMSEAALLRHLEEVAARNRVCTSYIGMGYYPTLTPSVILRNLLENPSWYTPYTPYQAELAQGRLEGLLNFQTMVMDLSAMDAANASLLDEGTAAAEAMTMMHRLQKRVVAKGARRFLLVGKIWPQTLAVVKSHADPLGIELVQVDEDDVSFDGAFGVLVQNPDACGRVRDLTPLCDAAHEAGLLVAVAADPLSLVLVKPPGEMGADMVFGSAQRFGVPMGYGGPHAAFFATRTRFMREMPGRIIGVSIDEEGHAAYRMALQTREQHIRREKAKSNICTAQALLANVAGMYAVYHGPDGLQEIALRVHGMAAALAEAATAMGYQQLNEAYFDTVRLSLEAGTQRLRAAAGAAGINLRYMGEQRAAIALDETTTRADLDLLLKVLAEGAGREAVSVVEQDPAVTLPEPLRRTSPYLQHPVFHEHRSESRMMRYLKRLERKDIGLDVSMIPLGSCTMKLNAATEMIPITWPAFSRLHPFAPADQAEGYRQIAEELSRDLADITEFAAVSLQPNSGAQGEYGGLMVIRAYHHDRGEPHRDVVLIPASAHGTNPASAVMCGMKVVVVACDEDGNVDLQDLEARAEEHRENLAALMVTYPSTHGVFEEPIREICELVHRHGGQVYMDGANLNAQVGLTSPARIGADVCHINLHKTFSIPHGGGGPGMGPIAVAEHLAPYLPGHPVVATGGEKGIEAVAAAPYGSASILLISYAYIRMLGAEGVTEATRYAILNANYIKARLAGHYEVLYTGPNGRVAHEMIFDLRPFKASADITEMDVAKRLMDYGFHAPTVSWPVPGTMMIEPTESEDLEELDRFCDALIEIRREIREIAEGKADREDNVLRNAPHTAAEVCVDEWTHPYPREQAAYPLPYLKEHKVWPAVARIDNTYGDRNLVCSCPSVASYAE